jgi:dihydropteroate synthase
MRWLTTRYDIDLSTPRVMGIVNVTPDSFSDGGQHASTAAALQHCEQLLKDGAHMLDIGGESSRPGAQACSQDEELARVLPVLRHALTLGVPVSVDTVKAEVMRQALDLGVDIVNDIRALQAPGAMDVITGHARCGVCLMHMQGEPRTMQAAPLYEDVVAEVRDFLSERVRLLVQAGVAPARIALDPGIGFGKSVAHNLALLPGQGALLALGGPWTSDSLPVWPRRWPPCNTVPAS